MSLIHSPQIVTNGLTMYYDMNNTQKSFKGVPTTNLSSDIGIGAYLNVPSDVTSVITTTGENYKGSPIYKQVLTPITATGVSYLTNANNPGIGVVTGGGGGGAARYTGHSIFFKPEAGRNGLYAPAPIYTHYSNISGWQSTSNYDDMGDGWFRANVIYYNASGGSDGKYWAINPAGAVINAPITIYWAGPFKEDRNDSVLISPYVNGTRGFPFTGNYVDPDWSSWSIDSSGYATSGTRTIYSSTYTCLISDSNSNTRQSRYFNVSPGTTYTFTVKFRKISGAPTLRFQLQSINGGGAAFKTVFPTTAEIGLLDIEGVQTATYTYTTSSVANSGSDAVQVLWFMQDGNDYTGYTHSFELSEPAVELGTVSKQTRAIADLTGNNLITPTSLTYESDGTFSFNGSNDKITLNTNTIISGTSPYTIDVVFKTSAAGTDFIFGNYGSGNSGGLEYYVYQSKLNNYIAGNTQSATTLNLNQWYIASVTRSGSTITHYLNGVADGSGTNAASISATNPFTIGNGHDYTSEAFGGTIGAIKVYNRALSAAEVLQNFNALKQRFFGYASLTYTFSSNVTLTGNGTQDVTMFKNANNGSWNGQVYSLEKFSAPCTIEFLKNAASGDNSVSYAMIGWNSDPTTNADYNTLDHASYPYRTDSYQVYNNGTNTLNSGTWETNKRFYVVYDTDGYIRHYNGGTLLYTANYGTGITVYVDSSFYSVDATYGGFTGVKVSRQSWNGSSYV